jgi:hypothetical protein
MRKDKLFNVTITYRGDYPGGGGYDQIHTKVVRRVAKRPEQAIASVQKALNFGHGTTVSLATDEVTINA